MKIVDNSNNSDGYSATISPTGWRLGGTRKKQINEVIQRLKAAWLTSIQQQ